MVEYSDWISIAAEVAKSKYGKPTFEESSKNISEFARVWNKRKRELQAASFREARSIADQEF